MGGDIIVIIIVIVVGLIIIIGRKYVNSTQRLSDFNDFNIDCEFKSI